MHSKSQSLCPYPQVSDKLDRLAARLSDVEALAEESKKTLPDPLLPVVEKISAKLTGVEGKQLVISERLNALREGIASLNSTVSGWSIHKPRRHASLTAVL